jgi:hypothetical protein
MAKEACACVRLAAFTGKSPKFLPVFVLPAATPPCAGFILTRVDMTVYNIEKFTIKLENNMPIRCVDCQEEMHKIALIDRGHAGVMVDMEYRLPETKRSFWTGQFPVAGKVHAFMCCKCGMIRLYGVDPEDLAKNQATDE